MKNFFSGLIFLPCLFAITSCKEEMSSQLTSRTYEEVIDKEILWGNIFDIDLDDYIVYFYSPSCGHCRSIKDIIISYALETDNFYLLRFNEEVVVSHDVSKTIGVKDIENLSILGTPALIEIEEHEVIKNIAGSQAILDFLHLPSSH